MELTKTSQRPGASPLFSYDDLQEGADESPTNSEQPLPWSATFLLKTTASELKPFNLGDFQMTIRFSDELYRSSKKRLLMLVVLIDECFQEGVGLREWIALYELTKLIQGQKSEKELSEHEHRAILMVSMIMNQTRFDSDYSDLFQRKELRKDLHTYLISNGWLPHRDILASWRQSYKPGSIEFRIVPLEKFLQRNEDTARYSGYSKGYDDHGNAAPEGRTRHTPELDGSDVKTVEERPGFVRDLKVFSKVIQVLSGKVD